MSVEITLKRGAVLNLSVAFKDHHRRPIDLTGRTVTSQVRDARNEVVAELPVNVPVPSSGVAGVSGVDTTDWPLGTLRCDFRMLTVSSNQAIFSETFAIHLQRGVTEGGAS